MNTNNMPDNTESLISALDSFKKLIYENKELQEDNSRLRSLLEHESMETLSKKIDDLKRLLREAEFLISEECYCSHDEYGDWECSLCRWKNAKNWALEE